MRNNEEIIKILDSRRKEKEMSISELARRVDMAKSAVSRYFNFTREFPINRANDFAKVLDLDVEYLLGFEEEQKNKEISIIYNKLNPENQTKTFNFASNLLEGQQSNIVDMREYKDVYIQSRLSAGTGIVDLEQQYKELISYSGYVPDCYDLAFQVAGDSMEPMYKDGEIVFVKHDTDVRNGQIGVVTIGDEAFIKKMYIEDDCLRLVSLNKKYDDIVAKQDDDVKVVGRVIF